MPSRRSQPQGAPTELSEATRRKFAELLMELAALCIGLLAGVTEALLQSDTLTGAERAALRVAMAGLGPIARQVEAQAAQFRDGLSEPDTQPPTAATPTPGAPTLGGAAGRRAAMQAPFGTRAASGRRQTGRPGGRAGPHPRPPPTPRQKISLGGLPPSHDHLVAKSTRSAAAPENVARPVGIAPTTPACPALSARSRGRPRRPRPATTSP